jgi:hypothetical protein
LLWRSTSASNRSGQGEHEPGLREHRLVLHDHERLELVGEQRLAEGHGQDDGFDGQRAQVRHGQGQVAERAESEDTKFHFEDSLLSQKRA